MGAVLDPSQKSLGDWQPLFISVTDNIDQFCEEFNQYLLEESPTNND